MHEGRREVVVVFSGGGTGGHLYPALTLADAMVQLRPDVRPFFVGAQRGIEARLLPERGLEHTLLPVRGIARRGGLSNLAVLPAFANSMLAVGRLFQRLQPVLVVVTGGYAGAPAGMMAALEGRFLALQEQNSVPGLTTRLLARRARQIHLAFPEAAALLPRTAQDYVRHSGNPVRVPEALDRLAARTRIGLPTHGSVLLVVGGSQGSEALNRVMIEAVRAVADGRLTRPDGLEVLWSTGPRHLDSVRFALGQPPEWVHLRGYLEDMPAALGSADLALSRAGAMATSEFLAWGLPMVLVPLPTSAGDHQRHNAATLAAAGAAVHLPQAALTGASLWTPVVELLGEPDRLAALRAGALSRAQPDAARRIAEELAHLLPPLPSLPSGGATERLT